MKAIMLAIENNEVAASIVVAGNALSWGQIFPYPTNSSDDNSATRSVRRFTTAELIRSICIAAQIDCTSKIVVRTGTHFALHLREQFAKLVDRCK